jgi:hypothetical protein
MAEGARVGAVQTLHGDYKTAWINSRLLTPNPNVAFFKLF